MITESILIDKCLAGDRHYQKLLYKKYASVMLGICARYFRNIDEAEDVLQEGFIKVFSNLSQFKKEGSFEGWIKRIMINTALNTYHSNVKRYFQSEIDDDTLAAPQSSQFDEEFSSEILMKLIQELPDGYRLVFNLYAIEGYSHKEIAEMLDINENTSKSQLSRARALLQKRLAGVYEYEPSGSSYK